MIPKWAIVIPMVVLAIPFMLIGVIACLVAESVSFGFVFTRSAMEFFNNPNQSKPN